MTLQCQSEISLMPMINAASSLCRTSVSIGEISVGISGDSEKDICLDEEMSLFRVAAPLCDIEVTVERVGQLEPLATKMTFDSGGVWTLREDGAGFAFDFASRVLANNPYKRFHVDRQFARGSVLLSRQCFPDDS